MLSALHPKLEHVSYPSKNYGGVREKIANKDSCFVLFFNIVTCKRCVVNGGGGGGEGGGLKIYLHLHKQSAGKSFIARAITVCLRLKPVLETTHEWINGCMNG